MRRRRRARRPALRRRLRGPAGRRSADRRVPRLRRQRLSLRLPRFDDEPGRRPLEAFVETERLDWLGGQAPARRVQPPPAYRVPGDRQLHRGERPGRGRDRHAPLLRGPAPPASSRSCSATTFIPTGATAGADGRDDADALPQGLPRSLRAAGRERGRLPHLRRARQPRLEDVARGRDGAGEVRSTETRPFYMDGIRYRVAPTGDPREVEIFVLDTHVLLSAYSIARRRARRRRARDRQRTRSTRTQPWAVPQHRRRMAHGGVARGDPRRVPRALEDRDGPPPDLVFRRQQVPAGARCCAD